MTDRFPVQLAADFGQLQNRLQLGRERDAPVDLRVVERLDAQAVAREQKLAAPRIPDREREHAAQVIDAPRSVVLVQVHDGFGVARRAQRVAVSRERLCAARRSCRSRR